MTGPAHSLFVPLSLAVGFAMGASYLLSSSLVPVLSNWLLRQEKNEPEHPKEERFERFRRRFQGILERIMEFPKLLLGVYAVAAVLIFMLLGPLIAQELFPSSASKQFRLRIDAPDGTRVAVTEALVQRVSRRSHRRLAQTILISPSATSEPKDPRTQSTPSFCGPVALNRPSSMLV